MTGLRQGELLAPALARRRLDGAPDPRRRTTPAGASARRSPALRAALSRWPSGVAGELDRHFERSDYTAHDHLVFCHPETGEPYDASQIRKRFYAAMEAAGMGHRSRERDHLPRAAPHLRDADGGRRHAHAHPPGVDGAPDPKTTEIYADYAPDPVQGARWAEAAFSDDEEEEDEDATDGDEEASQ